MKTRTMDCTEIQFMVLFVYPFLLLSTVWYGFVWKGGDTVRHKDDARMNKVIRNRIF